MSIDDKAFDSLTAKLKQVSGIVITRDKSYLLESRLLPVTRKHGITDLNQLAEKFASTPSDELVTDVVDAMTTNETLFFRDLKPFETFRNHILPYLQKTRENAKKFRIWCAACSTGQEPYSLSMIIRDESAKFTGWTTDIIATDLSTDALAKAQEAVYSQFEVQRGMPVQLLMKYFTQEGERWHLKDEVKNMPKFSEFNLLQDPSHFGKFDIVFLRNVLIYFDNETKKQILERIASLLPDDGMLFLGGAETVLGITDQLEAYTDYRGLYRKTGPNKLDFGSSQETAEAAPAPTSSEPAAATS